MPEPVAEVQVQLEDQSTDPRAARRVVVEAITASGSRVDPAEAALLVDELVSNAVRHAGGAAELVLRVGHDWVWAEVRDGSPTLPTLRKAPPNGKQEGGRGLWLVDRLSTAWGTRRVGTGKAIWFESRARDGSPPQKEGSPEDVRNPRSTSPPPPESLSSPA